MRKNGAEEPSYIVETAKSFQGQKGRPSRSGESLFPQPAGCRPKKATWMVKTKSGQKEVIPMGRQEQPRYKRSRSGSVSSGRERIHKKEEV